MSAPLIAGDDDQSIQPETAIRVRAAEHNFGAILAHYENQRLIACAIHRRFEDLGLDNDRCNPCTGHDVQDPGSGSAAAAPARRRANRRGGPQRPDDPAVRPSMANAPISVLSHTIHDAKDCRGAIHDRLRPCDVRRVARGRAQPGIHRQGRCSAGMSDIDARIAGAGSLTRG